MFTSVRYILLCALRDRLFPGLIGGIVIAALISYALGGTAFMEEREMSLAFAGASARLITVLGLIVFSCFHVRHAFESREIDVMLSRPMSRSQLAFAYWLGFAVIATLLVIPVTIIMLVLEPFSYSGLLGWSVSILLEGWFVVALSLFAALALKSAVSSVMASFGIYLMSRMMAYFVLAADNIDSSHNILLMVSHYVLKAISIIMPRLDFYGKTEWLIYGFAENHDWQRFMLQAAIFIPLLITVSIIDFRRKQF